MADNNKVDLLTKNLLCLENSNTCFDVSECNNNKKNNKEGLHLSPWDDGLGSVCFPIQSDESLRLLIKKEKEHLPKNDYLMRLRSGELELSVRKEAIDWIMKVGFLIFQMLFILGLCLFDSLEQC